jgi:FAD:protein FMN transferase
MAEPVADPLPIEGPAGGVARLVSRFERRAMGSPLRLTLVGLAPDRAQQAWEATSALIETIEQALSRFRDSSDLVALNRRAGDPRPTAVERHLYESISAAHRAWRVTGGAFDPRVLGDLERLGYVGAPREQSSAGPQIASAAASFPADDWLVRVPRDRLLALAQPVDLGGIGKGLALRWAFAALNREFLAGEDPETAGALLEAGGDIIAAGASPDDGAWLIGLEHPASETEIAAIVVLAGAVCTSSIAVHHWKTPEGRTVHHLVDPRTGEPGGAGLLSVTVAGDDPAWSEVWSKSLFLAGASGIGPRARGLGLAAWWVREDGALEMTPAAREQTAWVVSEE